MRTDFEVYVRRNSIEAVPQRKLKNGYGAAEDGNGGGVSGGLEQTNEQTNSSDSFARR
jgi:hypothetical protein